MVFDYFAFARAKKNQEALEKTNPQNPVLKQEDQDFLDKVASHDASAPPLPPAVIQEDGTVQEAQTGGLKEAAQAANTIALPDAPEAEIAELATAEQAKSQKRTWASYVPSAPSLPSMPSLPTWRSKAKPNDQPADDTAKDTATTTDSKDCEIPAESKDAETTEASESVGKPDSAADPTTDKTEEKIGEKVDEKVDDKAQESQEQGQSAAYPPGVKVTENVKLDQAKRDEDVKEVSVILDRLNLSSINNRVFSFSKESQKIYEDFTVVLKDMINGGPTAYHDMEKLLKENDQHLKEMFYGMPPFVQTLVKSLPAKLGGTLGPEMLAAASEKPGADLKSRMAAASQPPSAPATKSSKKKKNIPSVKGLANEQGAIATMLRSIVTFLKARFPAFVTGTNVIMSIAVFLLLFVFWYCHKRGRETRLQREADAASINEASDAESGLEDSQDFTPDESKASEEEEGDDEEAENIGLKADEDGDTAPLKSVQDILNQPIPAEVPLPVKEEEALTGEAGKST
ncbi:hypothetical protein K461DRAFT_277231 [Myriangium duriaei CBS 260.36]|uniref:Uncharacterized protein n=1 Tax=Myriangium duriaei CBS 260.36 TaxID=1168546 RepID=A0A9P4J6K3_9PEZI|nr:hypothetical protein K461DRAFT_277231 [Myriangium duriaei CBS 260.36]